MGGEKDLMIYLKTIFSSDAEYPFLILNLLESYQHIDYMLICEANKTHTGESRSFGFDIEKMPAPYRDKVKYIALDVAENTILSPQNEGICHSVNEKYIRGSFVKYVDLHDQDIVVSVDADEVIYGHLYPHLLSEVKVKGALQLQLHQFFYKMNYLWKNNHFIAPSVIMASRYKNNFPMDWRYDGDLYPHIAGCHFSWCMPIGDLLIKMRNYAHAPAVREFATRDILENAITNKIYPFDLGRKFIIEELEYAIHSGYYPRSFLDNKTLFSPAVL